MVLVRKASIPDFATTSLFPGYDRSERAPARTLVLGLLTLAAGCARPAAAPFVLLAFNIANGDSDGYRTPAMRAHQAAFVAESGANVVGMEEVDVDVERSYHSDTGDDVLGVACTVATPSYSADGVRRCSGPTGRYLFGLAFRGDDIFDLVNGLPAGIPDLDSSINPTGTDRSHDAAYGVALGVRGLPVSDAYTVDLPTAADQPPDDPLFAELAASGPDSLARVELAARNLTARTLPTSEPRTALVTRLERPFGPPLTIIVTHIEVPGASAVSAHQLSRVLAVARAERAGPPAREVIVMGDFNGSTFGRAADFLAAGLRRAIDPPTSVGDGRDQIWVDFDLIILETYEVPTRGISDHPVAALATIL
jgi:hypothetical protein